MRSVVAKKILKKPPAEVRIFVRHYTDILVRIHELMEKKGMSQKQLADRMNKRPSEINKWLNGRHNFTLKTLCKLEAELGEPLIITKSVTIFKVF